MKTFKGTTGEWKLTIDKHKKFRIGSDKVPKINGMQLRIATVFCERAWQDKYVSNMGLKKEEVRISMEEGKANAKLIASAPELLEALQNIKEELEGVITYDKKLSQLTKDFLNKEIVTAEKAINKAL